ncbi:ER membrane protein complex subunit 2-like isoform X1 [Acanthaster planci]|uniref:ER membrane protein complex subunit 2 n=1 Tax=Acanthaster planci TaxID=133434 RepID=A0A8B7ZE32_ACAPL|nr:ER membrane protein complex subunit 2-like isoform X1 [Acanthaster planci]
MAGSMETSVCACVGSEYGNFSQHSVLLLDKMAAAISWEDARELLKKWREENARRSAETLELGEFVLTNYKRLGDEVWAVHEQVCIAALDVGDIEEASLSINALKKQFSKSTRVKRLQGMKLEAQGRFDDAKLVYEELLKEDPSNAMIKKRMISIFKAQDRIPEAIKELNKYLESFMADHEAWLELSELYIQEQNYSKAAFCLEELIMSNPHNHLYHQRYAEIRYTQGGTESMEIARKYFSQAVKLNSNNIRALYGLFLAATHLASSQKATSKSKKENIRYAAWASQQLQHRYRLAERKEPESQVQHLVKMIDSLQITAS